MTGIVTVCWISLIFFTGDIRATPPSLRMSAGTRSSAMTETAPASSAIFACSALVTSMITPPLSISARPVLTRSVPTSAITLIVRLAGARVGRQFAALGPAGPGSGEEGGDLGGEALRLLGEDEVAAVRKQNE